MRILYLGTDPSRYPRKVIHYPIIKTVPISKLSDEVLHLWPQVTHVLLTSPNAARHWFSLAPQGRRDYIAIGQATAGVIPFPSSVAPYATQEGVIELLSTMNAPFILWPRSSQSRSLLLPHVHHAFDLYHTTSHLPGPLPECDEIVFTSPSTVKAFIELFGELPKNKKLTAIGPVTRKVVFKE